MTDKHETMMGDWEGRDPREIPLTLGDICDTLEDLIKKGAHPGSIYWVLATKIEWPTRDEDIRANTGHTPPRKYN